MAETVLTWVFGILTTLFGGLNVFQWITLRSYKRVKAAEADKADIDNLRAIIETMRQTHEAEMARLERRVQDAENRAITNANKYDDLRDKYDELRDKYMAIENEFESYKQTHK